MESIKEEFGIIDGYELSSIGIIRIKKEELFEEIVKQDKNIIEECKKLLDENGRIYTYEKDKRIKAIYLFEDQRKEEKVLSNVKTIYTKEITDELKEKFNKRLLEDFNDELLSLEYDKVFVNDEVIQIDPKKSKGDITMALAGGAILGFALGWMIFDDIVFGFLWAVIFSGSFSGLETVVSKKRGRKRK